TAKSIAKWVWQRFSYGDFSEIQAKRSVKGASKGGIARSAKYTDLREQAQQLKALGANNTQIAKQLGVSRRTIINWFGV
ncbi:helix-turn-helix domain-containing protein, partial [Acinetobacter tandoii]|uniref:helix-turn-helix domain-containing protein n=1 Tax=Acinetobacter tandoii TaxID=202954 RepID=UPI004045AEFF